MEAEKAEARIEKQDHRRGKACGSEEAAMTGIGMKTNGVGKPVDWLNHTTSMADAPEFLSPHGGRPRHDGYVAQKKKGATTRPEYRPVTWRGEPVSPENAARLWGGK